MRDSLLQIGSGFRLGILAGAFAVATTWVAPAGAVSLRVKLACSSDYHALCSQYPSDSPEVRQCMRAAGEKLSARCLNALIAAGEVTEEEVARRAAQMRQ
ncbi:hypothetical protein [Hyphomicrobium sp.]|jgi:hypothetical protein|uniref:hypothetical protein n=1 Tax=Hyphomicrobium sp. TaxID=82 RepID=UPI002CAEE4B1|nr:hypothetical protein [Hyphomicrobium sp.]HVZ05815.1 hypothetical protein [Hyphomicrobium sp.]